MTRENLRGSLVHTLTEDAEAVSSVLGTLPRALRADARAVLREVWAFNEDPSAKFDEGVALARRLDALLHPETPELATAIADRLNQHWPLRIAAAEPQVVAAAGEAALSFYEARNARVEWLWRSLEKAAEAESSPQPKRDALNLEVVEKGGRS